LVLVDCKIIAEGRPQQILQNEEVLSRADIDKALGLSEMRLTPEDFPQDKFAKNNEINSSYITIEPGSHKQEHVQKKQTKDFGQPLVKIENISYSYSDENQAVEDIQHILNW